MSLSIYAIIGACAIGLSLGVMGSGGSILTVPVLVYLVGQEEKVAIAGSLIIVGSIALLGSLPYMRQKQIDWNTVLLFGVPGIIGSYGGAWLSAYFSGLMQLAIFAAIMLIASYFMLRPKQDLEQQSDHQRHTAKIVMDGSLVGITTGIIGIGGGFLIVPALVLLGGLNMRMAIGTSLVIIPLNSFSGFIKHMDVLESAGHSLDWHVIGIMIVLGGLGSFVGNKIANKVPQDQLKKGFGIFLIIMGSYILYESIPQLMV